MFSSPLVKSIVYIAFFGGVFWIFVFNVFSEAIVAREELTAKEAEKSEFENQRNIIKGAIDGYKNINERYINLANLAIPQHPNSYDTKIDFKNMALATGLGNVEVDVSLRGSPSEQAQNISSINFSIRASGEYRDILLFLEKLEKSARFLSITNLEMIKLQSAKKVDEEGQEIEVNNDLDVSITGYVYYYEEVVEITVPEN